MARGNPTPPGFDADARAARRTAAPVTIGGVSYHPTKLTNRRLRQIRAKARSTGIEARELGNKSKEYKEAMEAALERGLDEKEARAIAEEEGQAAEEVIELSEASLKEQLPLLLRDAEGEAPSAETVERWLEEELDSRDVGALMDYLLATDPTSPEPSEGK